MAYIIGEPIITIVPSNGRETRINVRFPVVETHTNEVHYRGATIALDPEKLWMLQKGQDPPAVFPDIGIKKLGDDGTYVESLVQTAELQNELEKLAEEEGIDLHYPEHIERWKAGAILKAADRCSKKS